MPRNNRKVKVADLRNLPHGKALAESPVKMSATHFDADRSPSNTSCSIESQGESDNTDYEQSNIEATIVDMKAKIGDDKAGAPVYQLSTPPATPAMSATLPGGDFTFVAPRPSTIPKARLSASIKSIEPVELAKTEAEVAELRETIRNQEKQMAHMTRFMDNIHVQLLKVDAEKDTLADALHKVEFEFNECMGDKAQMCEQLYKVELDCAKFGEQKNAEMKDMSSQLDLIQDNFVTLTQEREVKLQGMLNSLTGIMERLAETEQEKKDLEQNLTMILTAAIVKLSKKDRKNFVNMFASVAKDLELHPAIARVLFPTEAPATVQAPDAGNANGVSSEDVPIDGSGGRYIGGGANTAGVPNAGRGSNVGGGMIVPGIVNAGRGEHYTGGGANAAGTPVGTRRGRRGFHVPGMLKAGTSTGPQNSNWWGGYCTVM
jgi:hypothetical protein